MSKNDTTDIKRIAQKAAEEALEELQKQLLDLLNAFEAAITEFKQQVSIEKNAAEAQAAVKEETFTCLKFEGQKGAKIGEYEVAHKGQNLPEHWNHAYNILRRSNATINSRYCGEGYQHSYWLYGEGRIYRQKLAKG